MILKEHERILDDILNDIKMTFGISTYEAELVEFGYANLKWKIHTDLGLLFLKQYNKKRYPEQLIDSLATSLNIQNMLSENGILCPKLFERKNSCIIRTRSGERYSLMEFLKGRMLDPGTANSSQMYHLGQSIGKMHRILNSNAPKNYPLHWQPDSKDETILNLEKNLKEAVSVDLNKYVQALETQKKIIEQFNLDAFSSCQAGWVHWDLFVDNLLFYDDTLSSILDFDRLHYIYQEFDISRPLLSGTILDNKMNLETAEAFVTGYNEIIPITSMTLVRSIQLTWWKEAAWVNIHSENSRTMKRFADELIWVGEHWADLENIFKDMRVFD